MVKGKANWQLTVETVESGISLGLILLLFTIALKYDYGNRVLIFLVCRLRSVTPTEDQCLSSSFKIMCLDMVDGVSLIT